MSWHSQMATAHSILGAVYNVQPKTYFFERSQGLGVLSEPEQGFWMVLRGTKKNWTTSPCEMASHHEKASPGEGLPRPTDFSMRGRGRLFVVPLRTSVVT